MQSATRIAKCRKADFETFFRTCAAVFGFEFNESYLKGLERIAKRERMHCAWDGDVMVGTAGAWEFTLTIPGARVPAAGVTLVSVQPSHTRRGVLRDMMRVQLDDIHRRKEAIAILYASESSIYGRFGYGLASQQGRITLERDRARFRDELPPTGKVRLLDLDDALKTLPAVYDRVAEVTPGMFARSLDWWRYHRMRDEERDREGGTALYYAVWEDEGEPQAYALYRRHGGWDDGTPTGAVEVVEALATTPRATREIWRFIFGIDLVKEIRSWFRPTDDPLMFMLSEPRRLRFTLWDGLWVRLVDVGAALQARGYRRDGSLVLRTHDAFCPWNEGTWKMQVENGLARVEKSTDEAQLELNIEDLGSAYLGGIPFGRLERAGRCSERVTGAVARADDLFGWDPAPYCPEIF